MAQGPRWDLESAHLCAECEVCGAGGRPFALMLADLAELDPGLVEQNNSDAAHCDSLAAGRQTSGAFLPGSLCVQCALACRNLLGQHPLCRAPVAAVLALVDPRNGQNLLLMEQALALALLGGYDPDAGELEHLADLLVGAADALEEARCHPPGVCHFLRCMAARQAQPHLAMNDATLAAVYSGLTRHWKPAMADRARWCAPLWRAPSVEAMAVLLRFHADLADPPVAASVAQVWPQLYRAALAVEFVLAAHDHALLAAADVAGFVDALCADAEALRRHTFAAATSECAALFWGAGWLEKHQEAVARTAALAGAEHDEALLGSCDLGSVVVALLRSIYKIHRKRPELPLAAALEAHATSRGWQLAKVVLELARSVLKQEEDDCLHFEEHRDWRFDATTTFDPVSYLYETIVQDRYYEQDRFKHGSSSGRPSSKKNKKSNTKKTCIVC